MRKITNSSELNQYYGKINKHIDEYIKSYNVTPSEIYRYINKNMSRFLENIGISDIENIQIVVKDVVEHRKNMERDKIFKFEQFSNGLNESLISLTPSGIDHEKVLSDYYNTSLGHINILEPDLHLYEIRDFDNIKKSIIFSIEEIGLLKNKIQQKISDEIMEKEVELNSLYGQILDTKMDFLLKSIVSPDLLKENINSKLDDGLLIKMITTLIPNSMLDVGNASNVKMKEIYKGYYIWEV